MAAIEDKNRKEALDAEATFSYSIGATVFIEGIKSKPGLNGLKGTIVKSFDEETGRYPVKVVFEGELKQYSFCRRNLIPEVSVSSLKTGDLMAILYKFDNEWITDFHCTEKVELQRRVSVIVKSVEDLAEKLRQARNSKKRPSDDGPVPMDIDPPPKKKQRQESPIFCEPGSVYLAGTACASYVLKDGSLCKNCQKTEGLCDQHQKIVNAKSTFFGAPGTVYKAGTNDAAFIKTDGSLCKNCVNSKRGLCGQHAEREPNTGHQHTHYNTVNNNNHGTQYNCHTSFGTH